MITAAARGEPYACFVRPGTRIPFMTMPDAIEALLLLAGVERARLTRTAYNLTAFSPPAEEICNIVMQEFPGAQIPWKVDEKRKRIVDSGLADGVDTAAPRDWHFAAPHAFTHAVDEFLVPHTQDRYRR